MKFPIVVPAIPSGVAVSHSLYAAGLSSIPALPQQVASGIALVPHGPIPGMGGIVNKLLGGAPLPPSPIDTSSAYNYGGSGIDIETPYDDGSFGNPAADFSDGYDDIFDDEPYEDDATMGALFNLKPPTPLPTKGGAKAALSKAPSAPSAGHNAYLAVKAKAQSALQAAQALRSKYTTTIRGIVMCGLEEILGDATSDALSQIDQQMQSLQSQLATLYAEDAQAQNLALQYTQQAADPHNLWSGLANIALQAVTAADAKLQSDAANVSASIDYLNNTVNNLNTSLSNLQAQQQEYQSQVQQAQQLQYATQPQAAYSPYAGYQPQVLPGAYSAGYAAQATIPQYGTSQDFSYVPDAYEDESSDMDMEDSSDYSMDG